MNTYIDAIIKHIKKRLMNTKNLYVITLALLAMLLMSCGTTSQFSVGKGNKYQYEYSLLYPVENSKLIFQDDSIIIQFKFDEAAIRFQLQNISDSYLFVDWNKAAISIQGRCYGIRNNSSFYGDTGSSHSIMIPPLGYIRDIAIPRDNIYNDGGRWIEVDLLPTTDRDNKALEESIKKSVGKQIGFLLPAVFGSTVKNYEFDFRVDAVKRIAWKDYKPFQRVPEPPTSQRSPLGLDNVTTAVIAVGILGFSAYVLSIKKNPPSE